MLREFSCHGVKWGRTTRVRYTACGTAGRKRTVAKLELFAVRALSTGQNKTMATRISELLVQRQTAIHQCLERRFKTFTLLFRPYSDVHAKAMRWRYYGRKNDDVDSNNIWVSLKNSIQWREQTNISNTYGSNLVNNLIVRDKKITQ